MFGEVFQDYFFHHLPCDWTMVHLPQHLCTHSIRAHGLVSVQCVHMFSKWSSFSKAVFSVPAFPTGFRALRLLKGNTSKHQSEEGVQYFSSLNSLSFVTKSPAPFNMRSTFFPVFLLVWIDLLKTFLLPCVHPTRFNSRQPLPFLRPSLYVQAGYYSWVTCPCFYLLSFPFNSLV